MISTQTTDNPVLGILWPDDRRARLDYELLRLDSWLARCGLGSLGVVVECSAAGRSHTHEDLFETGRDDVLAPPARRLAAAGADVVAWACTSGSFIGGLDWARRQAAELERVTGRPVTSATLALIDAIKALGSDRVALLGAYPAAITDIFAGCLRDAGIEVTASRALECVDGVASFGLNIGAELLAFVADVDVGTPICIPDTAINTLDRIEEFERVADRPVITANQAVVWRCLDLLGVGMPAPGALVRSGRQSAGAMV